MLDPGGYGNHQFARAWLPTRASALAAGSAEYGAFASTVAAGGHLVELAKEALEMSPDKQDVQTLYLAMALALEAYQVGWNQPLPEGPGTTFNLALLSGPSAVSRVLALAMKQGHTPSALAALKALGQIGSRTLLHEQLDKHSSLIAALNYPDRRVQFAAATAILQLDPAKPFPGANRVISILTRALRGEGTQAAIVVDSSIPRGQTMAGVFHELGYETTPVQTSCSNWLQAESCITNRNVPCVCVCVSRGCDELSVWARQPKRP